MHAIGEHVDAQAFAADEALWMSAVQGTFKLFRWLVLGHMLLSIGITKFLRAFYTLEPHFLKGLQHEPSYVVLLHITSVAVRAVF